MARLGDLIQMLPLLESLPEDSNVQLLCDSAVVEWAKLLPGIGEIRPIDTALWRKCSLEESLNLPEMLSGLEEIRQNSAFEINQIFALNDHPAADALTAIHWLKQPNIWLTPELLLMRSYLRTMAWFRPVSRIHLADLWRYLGKFPDRQRRLKISLPERGMQFAKRELYALNQESNKLTIAFIIGSGGGNRRIPAKTWAGYWQIIAAHGDVNLILLGSESERSLADQFLAALEGKTDTICDLVGKTSPAQTISLINESDGVVSVDTGPLHWAAALNKPLLGLYFAEAGFYETGPYGNNHWVLAPKCRDYPCSSVMAERCQYKCRSYFDDVSQIGHLIYSLFVTEPALNVALPDNLQLYQSFVEDGNNRFRNLNGYEDHPEAVNLAKYCRNLLQTYSEYSCQSVHQNTLLDKFYESWTVELTTLKLSPFVPAEIREARRQDALKRLQTMKTPRLANAAHDRTLAGKTCASYC